MNPPEITRAHVIGLAVLFEGGLLVVALVLGWLLATSPFQEFAFRWSAVAWGVVATLLLLLVMERAERARWDPLRRLMHEIEHSIVPIFARCSVLDLALISLMAGIAEEALFRGVIQTALAERFDVWVGLVTASVLFGLVHFVSRTYAALAALIGLYLGALLLAFDNLLVPIVVHALYDFVALAYLVGRHRAIQREA